MRIVGGHAQLVYWGAAVATPAALPAVGNPGEQRNVIDNDGAGTPASYGWNDTTSAWVQLGGIGGVNGPASSTVDAIATWGNATGTQLKDTTVTVTPITGGHRVTAKEIVTGDLVMRSEERGACLRFEEHPGGLVIVTDESGNRYRLGLIPIIESESKQEPLREAS